MRNYMDAALHPASRIVDGSPERFPGYSQRTVTPHRTTINFGRSRQMEAVSASGLVWSRRTRPGGGVRTAKSTVATWDSQEGIA